MLILKILGWILLGLLGLLLLLLLLLFTALLLPVKLHIAYSRDTGFCASLRYLWIKKQLAPSPGEEPPDKADEKAAAQPAAFKKSGTVPKAAPEKEKTLEHGAGAHVPTPPALRATQEELAGAKKSAEDAKDLPPAPKQEQRCAEALRPEERSEAPPVNNKEETGGKADAGAAFAAEAPPQDKPPEMQGTKAGGGAASQPTDEKEDRLFAFSVGKLGTLIRTAGGFIRRVLQSLRYEAISLTLPVRGKDAADCAVKFGKVNAALSGFFTACSISGLRYTFKEVRVFPDFNAEDTGGIRFAITLRGSALWVLTAAVWTVRRLMKEKILFPDGIPFFKKQAKKKNGGKKI